MTTTGTPHPSLRAARRPVVDLGPSALITSAVIALAVTFTAMTFVPDLAHHGRTGFALSGVVMTAADALYLLGVVALVCSGAVPRGPVWTAAAALALVGSAAVVVAEVLLRVSYDVGTNMFSVVGPIQSLGMVGLGIGVLRAHRWSGWRRFTWLVQGLYVPVVLVPALAASGGQNLPALAGFHALVLTCGIAFAIELRPADG